MPTTTGQEPAWPLIALAIAGAAIALLLFYLWSKGRPFQKGDVFRASRLSRGNRIFPTQVAIMPTSVIHYTPQWIGKLEHSIHTAHIASVKIDTGVMFSDVIVETSGGAQPIVCHGHTKRDAIRMKELVERYQSDYYRRDAAPGATPARAD
jgi:predicted small integral membrane protein